jgi:tyrosyl-tRNA synthetase
VRRHEAPDEVPEVHVPVDGKPVHLPALLQEQFGQTTSHWRRQIDQGGVKVSGEPVSSYDLDPALLDGAVVQAGKRQFVRVHLV